MLLLLWLGVTETVIWLPVPVFAAAWGMDARAFWLFLALLPLCHVAGERLTARWSRMRRVTRFALAGLFGVAAGFALRAHGAAALTAAVVTAAAALNGMSAVVPDDRRQRDRLVPALILYFAASIAAGFIERMEPWRPWLAAGGLATLLLAIRRINRIALLDANLEHAGRAVPGSVLMRNRILAGVFTAVTLFIAFFRQVEAVWDLLIAGLRRVIAWLTRGTGEPMPEEMPEPPPVGPMEGLPAPEGEPAWFWLVIEAIAMAAGVLVLIAIAVLLLRQLLRVPALAKLLARWLAAWRERTRAAEIGGYVDEVERLETESPLSGVIRLLRSIGRRESWSAMTPEERIRWLFRRRFQHAGKRGFRYRPSRTPRENFDALREFGDELRDADERLHRAYTEVRYGGRPAAGDAAERLKSDLGL